MPSPTLPISSCLSSGYLDIIANSPHSSPSSTLSESSNSPLFISTKRTRAPRKRPNQCSAEASALLSSLYPNLFSSSNLHFSTSRLQQPPVDPFPPLLPSFPISNNASLVSSPPKSSFPTIPLRAADFDFRDPLSPDVNAESILDEGVEEGIDSIMGNLSMIKESNSISNSNSIFNPCLGFGISASVKGALRRADDGEWWRAPRVDVAEVGRRNASRKKKKKKKRIEKEDGREILMLRPENVVLKARLGLKLDYEGVISEWCGGSPFSGEIPDSAEDVVVSVEKLC